MKIKGLHLRNIASIEKADIDFESGLNDIVTGTPASIFLISGDTGAGKSVILDGISMALYKKTPRIIDVQNKTNNNYTDDQGDSVSINSIEQYTRLGISPKDDCYSEVVFEGNDGQEYHAKLELGLTKSNKKDNEGNYLIKHSTPVWTVKVGSDDWQKVESKTGQPILDAVGLTFEQFGRMAMLAQGQFASFLTGDKKERESILEQLTNTEHFTLYGETIKRLFDKAKESQSKAQVAYDTESEHTLPQEKVDTLTENKKKLEEEKTELEKKDAANEATLSQVNIIETNREKANKEKASLDKLAAVVQGEEYKNYQTLIADWDATSTERQRLSALKEAESELAVIKDVIKKQESTFQVLSADLEARREALKAQGDPQQAVNDKQDKIDSLTKLRDALNPKAVNDELRKLSTRKSDLSAIATREKKLQEDIQAAKELEEEIKKDEITLGSYKQKRDTAQSAYDEAKRKADKAQRLFATMSTGIQDAMIGIRKRLVEEHAEICPLCGQHISEIHLDEEFKTLLTPFEKEQEEANAALVDAEKKRDSAKSDYDKLSGALNSKRDDLEGKNKAVELDRKKLGDDASKFSIDIDKPLAEQITTAQETIKEREDELRTAQEQAEEIQGKIKIAQNEKTPLDQALSKFNKDSISVKNIETSRKSVVDIHPDWNSSAAPKEYPCRDIAFEWNTLLQNASSCQTSKVTLEKNISECNDVLGKYYTHTGKTEADLAGISARKDELDKARAYVKDIDEKLKSKADAVKTDEDNISTALKTLGITDEKDVPQKQALINLKVSYKEQNDDLVGKINIIINQLKENSANITRLANAKAELDKATALYNKWDILNRYFGGTRFRTLVQTYILRPLLNNANIYLEKITDRYKLTCSEDNEQLSILVHDLYNKGQLRSATILSGGERFMISLALSLALSSLNRPDMNVNILFIDEGFGTLDENNLNSVMETLEKLQEIAGQSNRRVGIISHREELEERIPVKIMVKKHGEGRSMIEMRYE